MRAVRASSGGKRIVGVVEDVAMDTATVTYEDGSTETMTIEVFAILELLG